MKILFYALRQVCTLRWNNLIKLLSLTLGIAISSIFMCKVAYDRSYDDFHHNVEQLNILYMHYNINGKSHDFQRQCLAPIAPELQAKMPNVIAATRFQGYSYNWYLKDNEPISIRVAGVDTSFFDVIRLRVISGNPKQILSKPDGMMISYKTANKFFPEGDYIGKQLIRGENIYTIQGVFEDLPNNSHLELLDGVIAGSFREEWSGGDNSFTYFRTTDNSTPTQLTNAVNKLLAPRFSDMQTNGIIINFKVDNIRSEFANKVKETNIIVSLLAFIMILVAGFNFALISISSLSSRAKEVGVHKTSGASFWGIFWMLLLESIVYVVLAIILSAIILWSFKSHIESIIGLYSDVFVFNNLWGIGLVLIVMICVSGILPAILFAKIPVTQVFRRFTVNKARWKMILLFIQFSSTLFVFSFLCIMIGQYNTIMTHNLGYNYKNLVYTKLSDMQEREYPLITNELKRLSCVEDVTFSNCIIPNVGGGYGVQDMATGANLFSSAVIAIDSNYINVHGIELIEGIPIPMKGNYADTTNITLETMVVNQEFIRRLGVTNNQLCDFKMFNQVFHVCGVVKNFQTYSLKTEVPPLMLIWRTLKSPNCVLTVKLTDLTSKNITAINNKLQELCPKKGIDIKSYNDTIRYMYLDARMLKAGVIVMAIFLIIISIMGIIGYISNETHRRSQEIAMRKVFGSSSLSVIILMLRKLLILALASAMVAIPTSYIIASTWQSNYIVKMPLYWWIFASAVLFILIIICLCVLIQTWRVANSNPVKFIKAE